MFLELMLQMKLLFPDTMIDDPSDTHISNQQNLPHPNFNEQKPPTLLENIIHQKLDNIKKVEDKCSTNILQIAKLSKHAVIPTRQSSQAAGYDLYSAYDYMLPARGKILVKTDIQICVPSETYGRIAPRSGLAWKSHIDIGAGVIDQDYRGNICIVMFNHSILDFQIKAGDRIAQLICEKIAYPVIKIVDSLNDTVRGKRSFGSTGTI